MFGIFRIAAISVAALLFVSFSGCSDENAKFKPKDGEEPKIETPEEESRAGKSSEEFLPPR